MTAPRPFGPVVNRARITPREYDAIVARLKKLGRSAEAIEQVAAEFNRGRVTVAKIGERARA